VGGPTWIGLSKKGRLERAIGAAADGSSLLESAEGLLASARREGDSRGCVRRARGIT
jgi:hypothetical protein